MGVVSIHSPVRVTSATGQGYAGRLRINAGSGAVTIDHPGNATTWCNTGALVLIAAQNTNAANATACNPAAWIPVTGTVRFKVGRIATGEAVYCFYTFGGGTIVGPA